MTVRQKTLITGASGQVGSLLISMAPPWAEVIALDRKALDLSEEQSLRNVVRAVSPHLIINAAAYTAVDKAENEKWLAYQINAQALKILSEEALVCGSRLVHFSTDYVFDGKRARPYAPHSVKNPLSIYGQSKSLGEEHVFDCLPEDKFLLLRTAWVHKPGRKNFVSTMLRLMQAQQRLRVVADQIGTPTSAESLARATWTALERGLQGVHHFTDAGVASWFDFANVIGKLAYDKGLLQSRPDIEPIATEDYPQPAERPRYGLLDKHAFWAASAIQPEHWADTFERTWFPDSR